MFRTKICGVTRENDAVAAVDAGADAIGLNFYAKSSRSVDNATAVAIAAAVGSRAIRAGVFVNEAAGAIVERVEGIPLDAVQLHGDEPAEFVVDLPEEASVIRAIRVGPGGLGPVADQLEAAERIGRPFAAVLLDAAGGAGVYGGSGRAADWELIARERALLGGVPVILAGGLTPANVAEAITAVRPDGVDTASGVEASPGVKDSRLVSDFLANAKKALSDSSSCG